jgi:putative sigma-54 modulation protein
MNISISFKNVKHSKDVEQRLTEKSFRLQKFFEGNFSIKWFCPYKEGVHYTEAYISGPKFSFHASSKHQNMYKSFDLTLDKVERQILKQKEKVKSRRGHHSAESYIDPDLAWMEYDEYDYNIAS